MAVFTTVLTSCVKNETSELTQKATWNVQFVETEEKPLPDLTENLSVNWNLVDAETCEVVATNIKTRSSGISNLNTYKENISLPVYTDKTYHLIYWLQSENEVAYKFDNLTKIKIDYTCPTRKAALCGVVKHLSYLDDDISINLASPFSELNIYTEKKDIDIANEIYGKLENYSYTMTVNNIMDTYYPLEPEKSFEHRNSVVITRNNRNISKEKTRNGNLYNNIISESFLTEWKQLINTDISIHSEMMEPIKFKIDNIPVEQNKNTSVMGRFLTKKVTFNPIVNPYFEHSANLNFN